MCEKFVPRESRENIDIGMSEELGALIIYDAYSRSSAAGDLGSSNVGKCSKCLVVMVFSWDCVPSYEP